MSVYQFVKQRFPAIRWSVLRSLIGLSLCCATCHALALAGDLERPSIALPESTDQGWRDAVMQVLNDRSAEYLGGQFINANTMLRYGGDSESLSRFLAGLAKCPGTRIVITFTKDADAHWVVQHHGGADARRFHIRIRTGTDGLPLEELRLPDIVGTSETPTGEIPR